MGFLIWATTIVIMGVLFGVLGDLFSPIEMGLIFIIGTSIASTRAGRWKDKKMQEKEERKSRKD